MNTASLARLRVAEELASYYARYQNVELAIVGGSVARGVSDGHSDIDFGVFWKAPPTDDERIGWAARWRRHRLCPIRWADGRHLRQAWKRRNTRTHLKEAA